MFIIFLNLVYDKVIALWGMLLVIYFVIWLCEANTTAIEYIWADIGIFPWLSVSNDRKVRALLKHWLFNNSFLIESMLCLFELLARENRDVPILLDVVIWAELVSQNILCSEILIVVYFVRILVSLSNLFIDILIWIYFLILANLLNFSGE